MRDFSESEIEELAAFGEVTAAPEAGNVYFRIEGLKLPDGCSPSVVNALVCSHARDGYQSRLFFSQQIQGPVSRNWNGQNVRILEENWFAFSLNIPAGLRPAQIVTTVITALTQ